MYCLTLLLLFIGSTFPLTQVGKDPPQNNQTVAGIRISNQPIRAAQDSKAAITENKTESARIRWGHGLITWVFKFRLLKMCQQTTELKTRRHEDWWHDMTYVFKSEYGSEKIRFFFLFLCSSQVVLRRTDSWKSLGCVFDIACLHKGIDFGK